jgi:cyanophycin synthetase
MMPDAIKLTKDPFTNFYIKGLHLHAIPYRIILDKGLLEFAINSTKIIIARAAISLNSDAIRVVFSNKFFASKYYEEHGIPTPLTQKIRSKQEFADQYIRYKHTCVIKPVKGDSGRHTYVLEPGLDSEDLDKLDLVFPSILQEYVIGHEYRVVFVGKQILTIAEKTPAHLVTDGVRTLREQIIGFYEQLDYSKHLFEHCIDNVFDYVTRRGYEIDQILSANQSIVLSEIGNQARGAVWQQVELGEISQHKQDELITWHTKCNLFLNGMDVITSAALTDDSSGNSWVLECNSRPGLTIHENYDPDIAYKLIEILKHEA